MDTRREPYTLNGGESVYSPSLAESLALLHSDTQERAQRVLETGLAAARYVVAAAACAAMARKEMVRK